MTETTNQTIKSIAIRPAIQAPNSIEPPVTQSSGLRPYQTAEVTGVITKVTFPKNRGDPTAFKIYCPNIRKTFDAVCDLYCPIRENDTIYALCMVGQDGKLHIARQPFVQPPIDRDSTVQYFMRALRMGYAPCLRIYNTISKIAGGDEQVIPFLSAIAQSWNDTHNADIIFMFGGTDPDDIKKLLNFWHRERNLRRLYLFGLTKKEINACRMTCDEIFQRCMQNPYSIAAIPIEKSDAIMDRLNKQPQSSDRTKGAIVRVMWKNLHMSGWTGTPGRFIHRQFPHVKDHIDSLRKDYEIITEMETAYLKFPHKVETYIAEYIINMRNKDVIEYHTPIDERVTLPNGQTIERMSAHFTRELSEDQQIAVQGALDHTISIITGAAGTGKSTCLGQLIHNLELRGKTYAVCSFTGKAVARIREIVKKRNPSTIHRLISNTRKNHLDKRSTQFEKDIPLMEYEYIIIDEASMVTTELLYDLLQAYPKISHLVLVGDVNQLSPIGWGNMFYEVVKSETIPTYRLTTNYRVYTENGERDGIILNANAIITHSPPFPFEFIPTDNFSLIDGPIERVYDIIVGCFRAGIKADKIVVLSPYNAILDQLNRNFQAIYNVGARSITDTRGVKWMIGDRVMMTENDGDIGVFNGEQGTIRDITDKAILVDFGSSGCHEFLLEPTMEGRSNYQQGVTSSYVRRGQYMDQVLDGDEGDIDDGLTVKKLIHAYAISVDKSQGSEWDFVILCIQEFNTGSFLNKNRIYTALTRSKRACWCVVSDIDLFQESAVKAPPFRCDNLGKRLSNRLPNLKPHQLPPKTSSLEMRGDIPPEDDASKYFDDMGFDPDDFDE